MSRIALSIGFSWALVLLPASIFAQKSLIKESAEPSGKAAIQSHSSSSSSSSSDNSSSNSESSSDSGRGFHLFSSPKEERTRDEPREESSSGSSYSEPSVPSYSTPSEPARPNYSAPAETPSKPKFWRSESTSEFSSNSLPSSSTPEESKPGPTTESPKPSSTLAAPATATGTSSFHAGAATEQPAESRPTPQPIYDRGSAADPLDRPLPGVQVVPLPAPRGPADSHAEQEDAGGIVLEDDSLPPHVIHGLVLTAPVRPNYNTLGGFPKPVVSLAPMSIHPASPVQPPVRPTPPRGGNAVSDPYYFDNTNPTSNAVFTDYYAYLPSRNYNDFSPELACVYLASDQLVDFYRRREWCQANFTNQYHQALMDYRACFRHLNPIDIEPWMWPCYLTFEEEYLYWNEECVGGDPEMRLIRDLLRSKAMLVPQLLIDVDVTKRSDWQYVDTAFAAPAGGQNYYAAMERFAPDSLLPVLSQWANQYPQILEWPSYVTLQNFYASYYRSDIWLFLRTKANLDVSKAIDDPNSEDSRLLAENGAWLSLALLKVDPRDREVTRIRNQAKEFLQRNDQSWRASALRELMR